MAGISMKVPMITGATRDWANLAYYLALAAKDYEMAKEIAIKMRDSYSTEWDLNVQYVDHLIKDDSHDTE